MAHSQRTIGLVALLSIVTPLMAATPKTVNVGDRIGVFNANSGEGELWALSEHLKPGQFLVVYFYPAAMTGGCTAQACAYRDASAERVKNKVEVVGVSGDAVNGLKVFKQVHNLNFSLLSDVNGLIAQRFGVPQRKGGSLVRTVNDKDITLKRGQSSSRWTFILNDQGKVVFKDTQVKAGQDSDKVLEFIRNTSK
jgi:thioredoxin-dependent peroxiredoxin